MKSKNKQKYTGKQIKLIDFPITRLNTRNFNLIFIWKDQNWFYKVPEYT